MELKVEVSSFNHAKKESIRDFYINTITDMMKNDMIAVF